MRLQSLPRRKFAARRESPGTRLQGHCSDCPAAPQPRPPSERRLSGLLQNTARWDIHHSKHALNKVGHVSLCIPICSVEPQPATRHFCWPSVLGCWASLGAVQTMCEWGKMFLWTGRSRRSSAMSFRPFSGWYSGCRTSSATGDVRGPLAENGPQLRLRPTITDQAERGVFGLWNTAFQPRIYCRIVIRKVNWKFHQKLRPFLTFHYSQ